MSIPYPEGIIFIDRYSISFLKGDKAASLRNTVELKKIKEKTCRSGIYSPGRALSEPRRRMQLPKEVFRSQEGSETPM